MDEIRHCQSSNDPAGIHRATPLLATLLIGLALVVMPVSVLAGATTLPANSQQTTVVPEA